MLWCEVNWYNIAPSTVIDSPRESPNSSIPRHRYLLLSWNHVPLLSFFRTVESQILEVNVLTGVDAEAFARNILICYFNVSVCFYANHVSVHAKDLSVDGDQAYAYAFHDRDATADARARGRAHMRMRTHICTPRICAVAMATKLYCDAEYHCHHRYYSRRIILVKDPSNIPSMMPPCQLICAPYHLVQFPDPSSVHSNSLGTRLAGNRHRFLSHLAYISFFLLSFCLLRCISLTLPTILCHFTYITKSFTVLWPNLS